MEFAKEGGADWGVVYGTKDEEEKRTTADRVYCHRQDEPFAYSSGQEEEGRSQVGWIIR